MNLFFLKKVFIILFINKFFKSSYLEIIISFQEFIWSGPSFRLSWLWWHGPLKSYHWKQMNLPLFSHWLIRNLSWWFHFHTCLCWELFLVAIWLPYLLLLQRRPNWIVQRNLIRIQRPGVFLLLLQRRTNWIVQRNLIRIQRILALEALLNVSFSFYSTLRPRRLHFRTSLTLAFWQFFDTYLTFLHFIRISKISDRFLGLST